MKSRTGRSTYQQQTKVQDISPRYAPNDTIKLFADSHIPNLAQTLSDMSDTDQQVANYSLDFTVDDLLAQGIGSLEKPEKYKGSFNIWKDDREFSELAIKKSKEVAKREAEDTLSKK